MSGRSKSAEFWAGVRAELPIVLGVLPFGMIYGVLALAAGLPPLLAQAMSAIVFAGSAQFIAVQLIGIGALPAILILTTLVVNLRHLLYSTSLAPHLSSLGRPWRWGLAYLLTDEAYAVVIHRFQGPAEDDPGRKYYFLGAGLTLWVSWQTSTAVGIFLGTQVPPGWSLDFTLALTFIGLVIPALKDRPAVASALSAGVTAVLTAGLPFKIGLLLAALVGILVGVGLERLQGRASAAASNSAEMTRGRRPIDETG